MASMIHAINRYRGHDILFSEGVWIYSDTGVLVSDDRERDCGFCSLPQTAEGHDGCLGVLDGVMNACCGHGDISYTYIQFLDGSCVRGLAAWQMMKGDAFNSVI